MNPVELAYESYQFLEKVLKAAYGNQEIEGDYEKAFIYRHARNVQALMRDIIFLFENDRFAAATVAARAIMESMFCVAASMQIPNFPAEKMIAESEKMVKNIKRMSDSIEDNELDMAEAEVGYQEFADMLRKKFNVTTNRQWKVLDVAQAGNLGGLYYSEYFVLCNYVHGSSPGILAQEKGANVLVCLQAATSATIATAGYAGAILDTKTPQEHLDNSTRLFKELISLMNQGAYRYTNEGA